MNSEAFNEVISQLATFDVSRLVVSCYLSIQVSAALFVSVISAKYVKQHASFRVCHNNADEETPDTQELQPTTNAAERVSQADGDCLQTNPMAPHSVLIEMDTIDQSSASELSVNTGYESDVESGDVCQEIDTQKTHTTFAKVWIDTVWNMRSVYYSWQLQLGDVVMNLIALAQLADASAANAYAKDTAFYLCLVMLCSRGLSAILRPIVIAKERICTCNFGALARFLGQLLDLLLFEEIFNSLKLQIKNQKIKVESTLRFRSIRSLHAVFESMPSALLLLHYVMRTQHFDIFIILSIVSSLWAVIDSTLSEDHAFRLGEAHAYLHVLHRAAEVVYRIVLLALIWTVCGDKLFAIVLLVEVLSIYVRLVVSSNKDSWLRLGTYHAKLIDLAVLALKSLVSVPYEEMHTPGWYQLRGTGVFENNDDDLHVIHAHLKIAPFLYSIFYLISACLSCCCCCVLQLLRCCFVEGEIGWVPVLRVTVSFFEFAVLTAYGLNDRFLFETPLGIGIFVAAIIGYVLYLQTLALSSPFTLPFGIRSRSRWGFAYTGELRELQKISVPRKYVPAEYWDAPCSEAGKYSAYSPAVFALAAGHSDIVEWLEERGAIRHREFTSQQAADLLSGKA